VTLTAISAARDLKTGLVVSVEVADDIAQEQVDIIKEAIVATEMAVDVRYMTKDEKFADESFHSQFEVNLDLLLGENPLRDSYEVTLSSQYADGESVKQFCEAIEFIEGVVYIAVPPIEVVESMHRTLSYITVGLVAFFIVLSVISMLLLNNTIRLAIYSKRYLINTMKLVGATKWYIMRPFLASALKQGVIAGVVAVVMICGVVYGAESYTIEGIKLLDYREVGIIIGAVLAVGVLITLLFSAFAVNKFVNMKSNKIYLY
jgi:cell division transport system permease protein